MLNRCWVETTIQSNLILSMRLVFQNGSNADLIKFSSVPRFRYGWNNELKRLHQTHQSSPRRCDAKRRHTQTPKISLQLAAQKSWEFRKMTKMRSLKSYLVGPILVSGSAIIKGCRTFIWLQSFKGSKIDTDSQWHVAQANSVLGMATVMPGLFFYGNRLKHSACCCFQFLCGTNIPKTNWEVVFVKRYECGEKKGRK